MFVAACCCCFWSSASLGLQFDQLPRVLQNAWCQLDNAKIIKSKFWTDRSRCWNTVVIPVLIPDMADMGQGEIQIIAQDQNRFQSSWTHGSAMMALYVRVHACLSPHSTHTQAGHLNLSTLKRFASWNGMQLTAEPSNQYTFTSKTFKLQVDMP